MASPRPLIVDGRPLPGVARTTRARMAAETAAQRRAGLSPTAIPQPRNGYAHGPGSGLDLGAAHDALHRALQGTTARPHRTWFDAFGDFLNQYPQCVTVPALFVTEFGAAMPLVNEGWSRLFGVALHGAHWRSAEQLAWALPIALMLPFVLFGARALPPTAYERFKRSTLDPWAERIAAADQRSPRQTKRGGPRPPRGALLHAVVDGGRAFGFNPYFRRYYGPKGGYVYGLGVELVNSAVLYTATGLVLDLPLVYFVPSATALSIGANFGGTYIAQIWGSLGVSAGRILAAFTCLFFTSHAISGLEAVAQQSPEIPDGVGYLGQLLIGLGLSVFFIGLAKKDAARVAVENPIAAPATCSRGREP